MMLHRDCNGTPQQTWIYNSSTHKDDDDLGDDGAIESASHPNKCIDMGTSYKSTSDNSTFTPGFLQIWDCNAGDNQKWVKTSEAQFMSKTDDQSCIDLTGGDTTNGDVLQGYSCAN
jgi:hypothetical protein